jgi:4-hydroxybenzoate polyprenyltransferase
MLWESFFQLIRQHPLRVFSVPLWLMRGRAFLKQEIAAHADVDVALLPWNRPFLEWLKEQKSSGRRLILSTAADEAFARRIADYIGIFDDLVASDGKTNLKGKNKARVLKDRFGEGFDYAGNSGSDREIWSVCEGIVAVETSRSLTRELRKSGRLAHESIIARRPLDIWRRQLRANQWSKNLLVFIPLAAAHQVWQWPRLAPALVCFVCLCLMASAVYLVNDLLDLPADRVHPQKRFRPIAAGELSIPAAAAAASLLFAGGTALAAFAAPRILPLLMLYAYLSLLYSLYLKRRVLVDVFVLAGLYTLRFLAGGIASGIKLSGWFLSFSIFLFLSLGFAKRAAELFRLTTLGTDKGTPGRGYLPTDFQPVVMFGVGSAFSSVLVLSLYMQSEQVRSLYRHPEFLWALFPLPLYWLTRVWLLAFRGTLDEDPVMFALKDRITWLVIAVCAIILVISASDKPFGFALPW